MIFAKYKGPLAEGENLTVGKIYVGVPEMDDDDTVDFGFFTIEDDMGRGIRTTVAEGKFEYLSQAYAVVVGAPMVDARMAKLGDAIEVGAIAGDKEFIRVKDDGCWKLSNFEILDKTNLYPDMVILDLKTNQWVRVSAVNESMWISTGEVFRPPTEFKFAVSDGSVLVRPCVVCVTDSADGLTKGKHYYLTKASLGANNFYAVINDDGKEAEYLAERFKFV
jgi:hypothetical protein